MRKLAAMVGVFGVVAGAAALPENNSSLAPLTLHTTKKAGRILGVCEVIANEKETYPNRTDFSSVGAAELYLTRYESRTDLTVEVAAAAKTTVLSQPKHGTLKEDSELTGSYYYSPDAGYVGKDSAEVLVEIMGIKVKVLYFIHVTEYSEPDPNSIYCSQGELWKISQSPDGNPVLTAIAPQVSSTTDTLTSSSFNKWSALAQLDATVAGTSGLLTSLTTGSAAGITVSVADLKGAAVGQTVGSTITLDTNASGNNRFIDPTPSQNEEWLPTSNPNEWVAKAGRRSKARSKGSASH